MPATPISWMASTQLPITSAVTRADSFAASSFAPCIEPERSMTSTSAMSGCSLIFSESNRTGMICSIRVRS